jgi:hypothetical protein
MRANPIKLKQYAPEWTQLLTAVAFTFATLFAGNLLAQDENSATESTNICLQTAHDALASCKSAARSDYQVAIVNALTSLTRQDGAHASNKPQQIWLMRVIPAEEDLMCDGRVVKSLAQALTIQLSIRLTSPRP